MNIGRLKHFCCVAKHLNFSRAAEECHIAQTAMSRSIAMLEEELGFRLFDRTHHYVELTPAGAYFLIEANKIVASYEFAKQSGSVISQASTDRLDIGFGGYDTGFVKHYVRLFMKEMPSCSIVLREYHYDDIYETLISGTSDIVFTAQTRLDSKDGLRQIVTSDSKYVIAVGQEHPLARFDEVEPGQLDGENFICPSDINMSWDQKNHLSTIFNHYGINPGRITRTNSPMGVTTMLNLGMGVTFLSEDIHSLPPGLKKLRICSDTPATKRHVVAHLTPARRPIINRFMEFVAKERQRMTGDIRL